MNEQEIFDLLAKELKHFIYSKDNLIKSNTGDGRGESSESEADFCKALKNYLEENSLFRVEVAPPRYWYDVVIYYEDFFLPINVKLTDGKQADNVSSKLGLFYALTGIRPENVKGINYWKSYNEMLVENYNSACNADYYFIVYNKNTENILVNSLKRINKLTPNGNNLPFQCNWGDRENWSYSTRTKEDQCNYLMNIYIQSWKKRINLEAVAPLFDWEELCSE